jgi:hypothetical protein
MSELLAASPGPAVHLAVMGIVAVIVLVVVGAMRWRHKREAAEAERQSEDR